MEILCHRGWWLTESEKNSEKALLRAFENGLGVEIDVRDLNGEIVIAHDPTFTATNYLKLEKVVEFWAQHGSPMMAINIKSDGLAQQLNEIMRNSRPGSWFAFDMSFPESTKYRKVGIPVAARLSEFEKADFLNSEIWLDSFESDWWIKDQSVLKNFRSMHVVSPELHGRDYLAAWETILKFQPLSLCTDHIEHATEYFDVS
jgi:hypothetical protein